MVERPRAVMSSIPSTIVRPLQDRGTPAGPKRSGIQLTPDLLPERVALQKGWHGIINLVQMNFQKKQL